MHVNNFQVCFVFPWLFSLICVGKLFSEGGWSFVYVVCEFESHEVLQIFVRLDFHNLTRVFLKAVVYIKSN